MSGVCWLNMTNLQCTTCRDKESFRGIEKQTLHWLAVIHGHYTLIHSGIKQFQCVVIRSWDNNNKSWVKQKLLQFTVCMLFWILTFLFHIFNNNAVPYFKHKLECTGYKNSRHINIKGNFYNNLSSIFNAIQMNWAFISPVMKRSLLSLLVTPQRM